VSKQRDEIQVAAILRRHRWQLVASIPRGRIRNPIAGLRRLPTIKRCLMASLTKTFRLILTLTAGLWILTATDGALAKGGGGSSKQSPMSYRKPPIVRDHRSGGGGGTVTKPAPMPVAGAGY
jgi:hypothetical protein